MNTPLTRKETLARIHNQCYVSNIEATIIYDELEKLSPKGSLLELGTGRAHSTFLFSHALPKWIIYTVDAYGSAGTAPLIYGGEKMEFDGQGVREVHGYIKENCLGNVIQIVDSFTDLAWELLVDAMFIDGTHWYQAVKADWEKFSPFVKKGGLVIMHDYNNVFDVRDYIEKEVVPTGEWKIWSKETIGFLRKL